MFLQFSGTRPTLAQLQLLKWINKKTSGKKKDLRILRELASQWVDVGTRLGLAESETHIIKANNQHGSDQSGCIRDTFIQWLRNGSELPNAKDYPVTWSGLYQLILDVGFGTKVAEPLKEALTSDCNNVEGNF